jgi:hypothetical protein
MRSASSSASTYPSFAHQPIPLQTTNPPPSTVTYKLDVMDDWAPSVALSKVSFASNYFYDVGMGFPKMSMLAFYWGIFPTNRPTLRKAVYAVTAYVCTAYFVVLWIDTFYCGVPVSVQWSQEEGACSVFYATTPFYFNFAVNLSSYVFGMLKEETKSSHRHHSGFMLTIIPRSLRPAPLPPPRNEASAQSRHLLHLLARYHSRADLHDPLHCFEHGLVAA